MTKLTEKDISELKENVELAPYTTLKIGGPAKYFVVAKTSDELRDAVIAARKKNLPYVVLGGGSNLLVSDKGFNGLAIIAKNDGISVEGTALTAEAGAVLARASRVAYDHGLSGLEFGVGIPGTVGGAVYGSASNFIGSVHDAVESVRILDEKKLERIISNEQSIFAYRDSIFKRSKWVILEATFMLTQSTQDNIKKKMDEITEYKNTTQKTPHPTSGCMFKNPRLIQPQDVKDAEAKGLGKLIRHSDDMGCDTVPLRAMLEKLKMKGFAVGAIAISDVNANFLVNKGGATAEDVMMMMSIIKQKIRDNFGIQLEDEVQLVGFEQ